MAAPFMSKVSRTAAGTSTERPPPPVLGSTLSLGIVSLMTSSLDEVVSSPAVVLPVVVVGQLDVPVVVSPVVVPVVVRPVVEVVPVVVVVPVAVSPVVVVGQIVVPAVVCSHAPRVSPCARWVACASTSTVIVSEPWWQRVTLS